MLLSIREGKVARVQLALARLRTGTVRLANLGCNLNKSPFVRSCSSNTLLLL